MVPGKYLLAFLLADLMAAYFFFSHVSCRSSQFIVLLLFVGTKLATVTTRDPCVTLSAGEILPVKAKCPKCLVAKMSFKTLFSFFPFIWHCYASVVDQYIPAVMTLAPFLASTFVVPNPLRLFAPVTKNVLLFGRYIDCRPRTHS